MAGMIVLGRKIAAAGSWSCGGISPAFASGLRNLCSAGDGRYVPHQNTFVAGNQEGGEPWPPPTQGGFVAEAYPGQAPQAPPTQGGFVEHQQSPGGEPYVPVTQAGFVPGNVDYNSYQPPPPQPGYIPSTGYSYPYVQYPPPPPAPYPQGQFVGENPWAAYQQAGYTYGQEQQQPGYVYPPQYSTPGYTPHVVPPPSYVQQPVQVPQVQHESYQSWSPEQQQAWAAANANPPAPEGPVEAQALEIEQPMAPEPVEGEQAQVVASTSEEVVHQVEEVSSPVENEVSAAPAAAAAQSDEVQEQGTSVDESMEKTKVSEEAAAGGESEGEATAVASEEHGEEFDDATAAAIAEMRHSQVEEDVEEKAEMAETQQEEEEPVKGPQSLLDVETSKAKPAPPPQSESFLDILSKTNLNRQARPRPPQLTLRSNRKTYARLYNLPRQILKSDLVNYFSEINLQKESIHITYDEKFYPLYAQIAFDSTEALRDAHKILQTKGRFGGRIVRWEQFIQFMPPGHPQISESMKNYLGRMLLMLHLPPEGRLEDVERFFESYGYDPSALSLLEPINMTLARFPKEGNRLVRRAAIGFFSSVEAMRALRERQGDFILNEPVELRLIQ